MAASMQRGGADLCQRRGHRPRQCGGAEVRQWQAGGRQHDGEKEEAEGQAEQEAHVGGADRAERGRQFLLLRVAQHLARGGDDREDGPQPRHRPEFPHLPNSERA